MSESSVSPSLAFLSNVFGSASASGRGLGRQSGETADTAAVADLLTDLSPAADPA